MPISKADRKYLERYAEPESRLADRMERAGHAVVVPVYGEADGLIDMLRSVPRGPRGRVLVVLVVNGKASAPAWVHERNRGVLGRVQSAFGERDEQVLSSDPPTRLSTFDAGHILVVDRSAPEHWFAEHHGVGLARKIGVDLCVRLHSKGGLGSPFIQTTDADAKLPADYFERNEESQSPPPAALLYPFTHVPEGDPELARAVLLYEISLRYYVLGLAFAGSPWAYHTIGSTIAAHADAYTKVRGFPKRDAAEDFYLLAKLAKVGPVVSMRGRPVVLRGRASNRVPFGTGAAVRRIAALGAEPFKVYAPSLFRYLRAWLSALSDACAGGDDHDVERAVWTACGREDLEPDPLLAAATALGAQQALASAKQRSPGRDTLARHLTTWFDAFRTLKLVHLLQRGGIEPSIWYDALREAPFTPGVLADLAEPRRADLDELREVSAGLERLEP